MDSRGFLNGMLTGGVIGAALTIMYLNNDSPRTSEPQRVQGKMGRARQVVEDLGSEVVNAWRK
ncbi:MAG: hypothetical protein ACM3QW_04805 [Ignavibacteriales bacterium]